jgi:hypothetical protein
LRFPAGKAVGIVPVIAIEEWLAAAAVAKAIAAGLVDVKVTDRTSAGEGAADMVSDSAIAAEPTSSMPTEAAADAIPSKAASTPAAASASKRIIGDACTSEG